MINSIEELHFNKKMQGLIHNMEVNFNERAKIEKSSLTMLDWINKNLKAVEKDGILEGLTDREKFLFVLALLSSLLQEG